MFFSLIPLKNILYSSADQIKSITKDNCLSKCEHVIVNKDNKAKLIESPASMVTPDILRQFPCHRRFKSAKC